MVDYLGNVRLSGSQDLEFATIDCDKSILVNFKHDDKLDEKTDSIIQFAMLYHFTPTPPFLRCYCSLFDLCSDTQVLKAIVAFACTRLP